MKKTLIFILMILVLMVSSCNLFLKEEYGELILSFDGTLPDGARALGPDGLPILSTTSMKIDIIREDGYTVTIELGAEEPKSLVELVPVGEKIKIIVTAINPSAQWSGRAFHTVVSGQNHVRVLLNKNISGLKSLLFTQTKTPDPSVLNPYNLTFYMGGKEVKAHQSQSKYEFGRDSKGRLYVIYYIGPSLVTRYTSEGESEIDRSFYSYFVNDYTTGKMYGINGSGAVYEIQENLSLPSSSIANLDFYQNVAAIDNNLVAWTFKDASLEIKVDTLSGTSPSRTGPIHNHIGIIGCEESKVNDLFIHGNYVYVLFNTVNESAGSSASNLYSLGGVVRYDINDLTAPPVKIGFSDSVSFENQLLKNYDYSKNFYGAVKVIGFDEENIYIADDGFDAAYVDYAPHIVKNRNRIAALNIATNALSFSDAGSAKWYNEWKEWEGVKTKILLWEKSDDGASLPNYYGMKYWLADNENAPCPTSPDDQFWFSSEQTVAPTDVFCYDQGGNLYIQYVDYTGGDKYVRRFALKEDGTYDKTSAQNLDLQTSGDIAAIAVDISGGQNSLYYAETYISTRTVKRFKWGHHGYETFTTAENEASYNITFSADEKLTALASNKDGLFVAVKEDIGGNQYKITVRKYDMDGNSIGSMEISIGSKGEESNPIIEHIHSMQILDGKLYAVSYKTVGAGGMAAGSPVVNGNGRKAVVSGKLLDLGLTSKNLPARPQTLWSGTQEGKGYAPFRFIAIKPKELVIANDGFYGTMSPGSLSINQRNKVLKFNSSGSLLSEGDAAASFSRKLYYNDGALCGFIWY
ncbi:hypothetical protein [Treponema putidum]|uniref:LVIVD repeat-containing protein n=1 Tax=Treponema putidum TaxID=221027 RepID=A0ABY5HSN7_9SPIR|nr:hypothetical protein [Treponema putidum]UTY28448.1 hypothetical protein E4N76_05170 [Treponema putidum]